MKNWCITLASLAACAWPATWASAAVFQVDFNTLVSTGYPVGSGTWQSYATPANVDGSAMVDSTGSTSAGITLAKVAGIFSDSSNGGSVAFNNPTGGPAWVTNDTSLNQTSAAADYFFTSTNAALDSFTLQFANFTPGTKVSLDLWMSRVTSAEAGYYAYSLDGGTTWLGFNVLTKTGSLETADGWSGQTTLTKYFHGLDDGNNAARYMNVSNLTITGSTLQIKVTDAPAPSVSWSGLAAMRLITTDVPEPASLSLFALAGSLLLPRRRHH